MARPQSNWRFKRARAASRVSVLLALSLAARSAACRLGCRHASLLRHSRPSGSRPRLQREQVPSRCREPRTPSRNRCCVCRPLRSTCTGRGATQEMQSGNDSTRRCGSARRTRGCCSSMCRSHASNRLATDADFLRDLETLEESRARYRATPQWRPAGTADLPRVAYFSMEFGLHEALPLYAGGLGVLAGDYLKTVSDLDIPVIGVGILWQQGYFRQVLDGAGRQTELYPFNEPASLPVQPVISAARRTPPDCLDVPGAIDSAPRVAGDGWPHDVVPARQQRSLQRPGRSWSHEHAVRRKFRNPLAAGDHPRRRWVAAPRSARPRD